ncbi:MAG: polysaccharide pyruvyl transferase family protein [Bacteroidaceae bacterium]|nr:polysaccharide pyruvyl transferase family protein [Bacteroidaceae bacterium]
MKIGIVTQPLYNNYGGLLQNYALQQILKRLGHEPKTIDFVVRISFMRYLLSTCKQLLISVLKCRRPQIRPYVAIPTFRNPIMTDFVNNHIDTTRIVHSYTKEIINEEHFDAIITGSDQVWRPIYNRYIEDMYLKFVPDSIKKIAYAASFGVDTWEYNSRQTRRCAKCANQLDAVSVRESTGVTICKDYLGVDATCVLDPTILAGVDAYKTLLKEKKGPDYLFAYILDITPEKQAYVESMAKSKGLKLIIRGADKNATLSVEDWLSMIANSSMVVTDSFHGTVFSILFHREFYSIVNVARGGTRFASLLCPLGLEHRMGDVSQLQSLETSPIDWKRVDYILDKQRQDSMNFLTSALKK